MANIMNKPALSVLVALSPLLGAATVTSGHLDGIYKDGIYTRYYVLQMELRIEKLAGPDWRYDADAADWNSVVPELEALYNRIDFPKP